jgi:membrane protein DedA with SNARE-associated domain
MLLASVTHSITSAVGNHGVYAVFALMALDAVFPAASELVMVYAGALAAGAFPGAHVTLFGLRISSHASAYVVLALAGTLGYLAGSIGGWVIGYAGGRPLLERRGRLLHLGPEKLDRAERWFDRWGEWGVLLGRLTPLVRSFVSIPAGVFRMRLWAYTVLTLIGSVIWAFAFAGAGWAAGASYDKIDKNFKYIEYLVVAAIVLAAALWILRRLRSTTLTGRAPTDPPR